MRESTLQYLRALGCRAELADDIMQEAFLRLHLILRAGTDLTHERAWLFRVARNLWIDHQREERRFWSRHRDHDRDPHPILVDSAPDPERLAIARQRRRLIDRHVARLPRRLRECLHMRLEGCTYQEIASALSTTPTDAADRVRRAVRILKQRLDR